MFRRVVKSTLLFCVQKIFFIIYENINKYHKPHVQATNKLQTVKNINKKANSLKIASIQEVSPFKFTLMDRIKNIITHTINVPNIFVHLPFCLTFQTFVSLSSTTTCNSKCCN